MRFKKSVLHVDATDQCRRCPVREVCPLIDALTQGVVLMAQQSILVSNCYLFATIEPEFLETKASLKLVP